MNSVDDPVVVILTDERDTSADWVVRELAHRDVPVFRFHTSDFPRQASMSARISPADRQGWSGHIRANGRTVSLERVRSIWYRRPRRFEPDPGLTDIERQFALSESRFGLGGVLRSLDARWVNSPESEAAANYKPWQLAAAQSCGLTTPPTLITNDPVELAEFRKCCPDGVIYKTLSGAPRNDDHVASIYTSSLPDDLAGDDLAGIRHATCLFQAKVPKRADLRVTIVGDAVFPVAIYNDHDVLDWRTLDPTSLRHEVYPLPTAVEDSVKRMVKLLGLEFGAIDLAVTPQGDCVFLEINPGGQWGWLQHLAGVPIAGAMADLLATGVVTT